MSATVSLPAICPGPMKEKTIRKRVAGVSRSRHSVGFEKEDLLYYFVWCSAGDGMVLTDGSGIIVRTNAAFSRIVNRSEHELIGMRLDDLWEKDREGEGSSLRACMRSVPGSVDQLPRRRISLPSGRYLDLELSVSPVAADSDQSFWLTIVRDVSERSDEAAAPDAQEHRYRELFENAVQGMFQTTVEGRVVAANPALLRMLKYDSLEELSKVDLATEVYVNPEDRKLLGEMLRTRGYCQNLELRLKRKDGKVITVLEHSRAVRDGSGNVVMYEGVIEDITLRKALEARLHESMRALKASESTLKEVIAQKDKLLSVLSHDLRSPFTSILGFCEILLDDESRISEAERRQYLTYIRDSAQDQLKLVNRLLEWSRVGSPQQSPQIEEVDLGEIVNASITAMLGLARQNEVHLSSFLPRGFRVRADRNLALQVFNNLIGNALKFTPPGGRVSVELTEDGPHSATVAVRDTGKGIPQHEIPRLFELGAGISRRGLRGEPGTGLGLPLCREIMQKLRGTIRVESEEHVGTSFMLTFPKLTERRGVKVLIVDNDRATQLLYARYLRKIFRDPVLSFASDGREALTSLGEELPHIILSDFAMPTMNGLELLRELKGNPATNSAAVFIITGKDSAADHEQLILAGADAVLTKPLAYGQLETALLEFSHKLEAVQAIA